MTFWTQSSTLKKWKTTSKTAKKLKMKRLSHPAKIKVKLNNSILPPKVSVPPTLQYALSPYSSTLLFTTLNLSLTTNLHSDSESNSQQILTNGNIIDCYQDDVPVESEINNNKYIMSNVVVGKYSFSDKNHKK